jgi:hypothetical protein
MHDIIHCIHDKRSGRLRTRTVNVERLAHEAAEMTEKDGQDCYMVDDGGGVCNSYGYRAESEVCLIVAVRIAGTTHVAWWAAQIPANKITPCGAASACVPCAAPIWDGRCNEESVAHAQQRLSDEARHCIYAILESSQEPV